MVIWNKKFDGFKFTLDEYKRLRLAAFTRLGGKKFIQEDVVEKNLKLTDAVSSFVISDKDNYKKKKKEYEQSILQEIESFSRLNAVTEEVFIFLLKI